MAPTTIDRFAAELGLPVPTLLAQLRDAGIIVRCGNDTLSDRDKTRLLIYLRRQHGATAGRVRVTTLTRIETTEVTTADATGQPRVIPVGVRRKFVIVEADDGVAARNAGHSDARDDYDASPFTALESKKP